MANSILNHKIKEENISNAKKISIGESTQVALDWESINFSFQADIEADEYQVRHKNNVFSILAERLGLEFKKPRYPSEKALLLSPHGFAISSYVDKFRAIEKIKLELMGTFFIYKSPQARKEKLIALIKETVLLQSGFMLNHTITRSDLSSFLMTDLDVEDIAENFFGPDSQLGFKPTIKKFYQDKNNHLRLTGVSLQNESKSWTAVIYNKLLEAESRSPDYREYIAKIVSKSEYKNLIRIEVRFTDKRNKDLQNLMYKSATEGNIDRKIEETLCQMMNRFFARHKIKDADTTENNQLWESILKTDSVKTLNRIKQSETIEPTNYRDLDKEKVRRNLQSLVTKLKITKPEFLELTGSIDFATEGDIVHDIEKKLDNHERYLLAVYGGLVDTDEIKNHIESARKILMTRYKSSGPPQTEIFAA